METHPTKEHQHQSIQSGSKSVAVGVALAAFTAIKLTTLLMEQLAKLLKKDPKDKEKDTLAIRVNGKTLYRGDFKDGVALKPKIDNLSPSQVAYLAAIVDAKQGQELNSKSPVQIDVNGQKVFEAVDGKVTTNVLPPGFAKEFTAHLDPIPEPVPVETTTKPSLENPREQFISLLKSDLDADQMNDAVDGYPKFGISLDKTVLENAREQGFDEQDIKQILESGPYYAKMEREGFKPEQIDKLHLNPLLNGDQKSTALPQESVDKLKNLGISPEQIQSIAQQTQSAGTVSPIIVVQQQLQQMPKTRLIDQISAHLSRITELPRKLIEQVKEGVSKAFATATENRQADLMPQQLQVAQSIEFLSSRYGQVQENGDRSFVVGPYAMTRTKEGALDLTHKERGSIFTLKEGQVKSKLNNADMGRFQKFRSNVIASTRQSQPQALEVG